jgi:hypothetical protein
MFQKSKDNLIIGITGQLHTAPHEWNIGGFAPKVRLIIKVWKQSQYCLGFGFVVPAKGIKIQVNTDYDKNVAHWWKRRKYTVNIVVRSDWLYSLIKKRG